MQNFLTWHWLLQYGVFEQPEQRNAACLLQTAHMTPSAFFLASSIPAVTTCVLESALVLSELVVCIMLLLGGNVGMDVGT